MSYLTFRERQWVYRDGTVAGDPVFHPSSRTPWIPVAADGAPTDAEADWVSVADVIKIAII